MDTRHLVVWLSAGLLVFHGGTLTLDLTHCSVLSWLYVRRHGLEQVVPAVMKGERRPSLGVGTLEGRSAEGAQAPFPSASERQPTPAQPTAAVAPSSSQAGPSQASPRVAPMDPTEIFCSRARQRVDGAVSQGLGILAGLALGGSVGGGSGEERP
ncbi:MAG: hypothetical protein VKP70_04725 [Cyanobacteriota bacterium]|nr:hypothetical protein [Cyanobacteriota bacterium]